MTTLKEKPKNFRQLVSGNSQGVLQAISEMNTPTPGGVITVDMVLLAVQGKLKKTVSFEKTPRFIKFLGLYWDREEQFLEGQTLTFQQKLTEILQNESTEH